MAVPLEQLTDLVGHVATLVEQIRPMAAAAAVQADAGRRAGGMKGIKIDCPTYGGRQDGSVMHFIETIRDIMHLKRVAARDAVVAYRSMWTKNAARNVVQASLRDNAALPPEEQLPLLEAALIERFSPADPVGFHMDQLLSLKQGPKESVEDYDYKFAACIEALDNYGHVLSDDDKKRTFRRGLVESLRLAVSDLLDKDATFSEMRKFVTKHETHHGIGLDADMREQVSELKDQIDALSRMLRAQQDEM